MANQKPPQDGKITRIDRDATKSKTAERIKQYYEQQLQRPSVRKPTKREGERPKADQFRSDSGVPRFLKSVQKRQESSWVYRSFKLPGTNRLVQDQRGQQTRDAEAAKKDTQFETREGKLKGKQEKSYINYLGDRHVLHAKVSKGMAGEISRLLSQFEKLLVERFEKGKTLEQQIKDGKPHFKTKTDAQWKSFFSKFLKRTVWKKGELKALKQFIFRGLVSLKKGGGQYSMLVGDMMMADGQMDKFARLKVMGELAQLLANVEPGSTLEAELLRRGLNLEAFRYLALAHKHGEAAVKTGAEETKGMFGQLKTEEEVAERLGIRRRKEGKGYGGPIKWGDEEEEKKHAFVPWGWWDREDRKGRPKAITMIIFAVIASLIISAILAIIKYL